jgi:hypothetical protein
MVYLSDPPRRTPAQRMLRYLLGIGAVALIVWGLASLPYEILRAERSRLFGEEITSGLVLKVRTDENPDHPDASLVIEYKYVDPDGYARRAEARMPDSEWSRCRPGAVITVLLVRGRPDMARVPNEVEPAVQVWLRDLMN